MLNQARLLGVKLGRAYVEAEKKAAAELRRLGVEPLPIERTWATLEGDKPSLEKASGRSGGSDQ